MKAAHDGPVSGHFAERKTRKKIQELYWWADQADDILHWCASCKVCAARKGKPTKPHHQLEQDQVSEPLQRIAMDILGPFETSKRGNKYVLVIGDYLTKWTEAFAIQDQKAETIAKVTIEEFICRWGIPLNLHSDKGANFESTLFKEMCFLLKINKTRTTALHPSSDGQIESNNKMIADVLAKMCQGENDNWDDNLPYVMAAYRSSCHSTTEETPNFLMLGREVRTPLTLLAPHENDINTNWVVDLKSKFQQAHKIAVENINRSHRGQKMQHDKRVKLYNFPDNTLVMLYSPKSIPGLTHKIHPGSWLGPFRITEHKSDCVVIIEDLMTKQKQVVNVDRLKRYVERDNEKFPYEIQNEPHKQAEELIHDNFKHIHLEQHNNYNKIFIADRASVRQKRNRKMPSRYDDYECYFE
jgi:hypothetical protein